MNHSEPNDLSISHYLLPCPEIGRDTAEIRRRAGDAWHSKARASLQIPVMISCQAGSACVIHTTLGRYYLSANFTWPVFKSIARYISPKEPLPSFLTRLNLPAAINGFDSRPGILSVSDFFFRYQFISLRGTKKGQLVYNVRTLFYKH